MEANFWGFWSIKDYYIHELRLIKILEHCCNNDIEAHYAENYFSAEMWLSCTC